MTLDDIWAKELSNDIDENIFVSMIKSSVECQQDMISSYKKMLKKLFSNADIEVTIPLFSELPHEKIIQRKFETTIYFKDFKFEKELCFKDGELSLKQDEILNSFREKVLLNISLGEKASSPSAKKRI